MLYPYKTQVPGQRMPARKPALQRSHRTRGDILRFFLARGDLCALLPIVPELANQIERAGDENGVFGGGFRERVFERALGIGDHGKTRGMMAGNLRELRGGNGARGARRREDDFRGVRKQEAGYFVDGFIAKSGIDQPDLAAGEVQFEKIGYLTGGSGIVRAIDVNVGGRLQFFEAARPDGACDPPNDCIIEDLKAAFSKEPRRGDGVY